MGHTINVAGIRYNAVLALWRCRRQRSMLRSERLTGLTGKTFILLPRTEHNQYSTIANLRSSQRR